MSAHASREPRPSGRATRSRRWSGRRRLLAGAGVLVTIVVVGVVVLAVQAVSAVGSLRDARDQASVLRGQVVDGDVEGARSTLDQLTDSAGSAASSTDGPLWGIASRAPFVGDDVDAVRTVSRVLDQVVTTALPPVVDVADQLNVDAFSPRDGRIDLSAVQAVAPAITAARASLTRARSDLSGVSADGLVGPLKGPVGTLKDTIGSTVDTAAAADDAAHLLPAMLGGEGTRRYLLLVQNNAELRATGGIPGSFAVLTAKDGRLSLGQQGGIQDLPPFDDPVVPLTKDEKTVFTSQLVTDLRNITQTPDFPRSAQIGRAMAQKALGVDVDGVISVDPVAMSYVLAATGPVRLDDGFELNQGNAVEALLSTVYRTIPDGGQQDAAFEGAARAVFAAFLTGGQDSRTLVKALVRAADENRLMIWSRRKAEQGRLATTGISGAFPSDSGSTPHVGVYLGDSTGSKLQYYLDAPSTATSTRCLEGGRQQITVRTTLTSSVPAGLPLAVTGYSRPAGTQKLTAWLYTPFGGRFTDIRLGDDPQTITTGTLDGRAETSVPVTLAPGDSVTLTATMLTGPGQRGAGVLSTTPGVRTTANDVTIASSC